MDFQVIEFSNAGVPAPGLVPVWRSLQKVSDGSDFLPLPVIEEIDDGGNADGGYRFEQPVTTELVRGVIDGGVALPDADRYIRVYITPDDFGMTDLIDAIVRGSRTLDPDNNTLTYKRRDGITTLVVFDVTKPIDLNKVIGPYLDRTPQ